MTAHRLLYQSFPRKDGTFVHIPYESLGPLQLIIVDEVSMLPKDMWDLLLSHKIHVIALGDPGQLPPVMAEQHGILDHPHIFLDEIMRQAQESEIIRLTMDIREGRGLTLQSGMEVRVVEQSELLKPGFLSWADQIICGKNMTRASINRFMRQEIMGFDTDEPVVGDRIICLRNNWDIINADGDSLVNGLSAKIDNVKYTFDNPWMKKTPVITFTPEWDGAKPFIDIEADYKLFTESEPTVNRDNFKKIPKWLKPNEFDYGYAITCHKSQGSEYDKVIVLEEYLKGDSKEEHARWLYTAATRAAKKLIVVRNYRQ